MRFGTYLAAGRRCGAAGAPWFIGVLLAALAISPARAVIVAPTPMVPVDIGGSYTSPTNNISLMFGYNSLFFSASFDFSVLLPATMNVTYSADIGGRDTYTYAGTFAGIYTDGAVSTAFSAVPMTPSISSSSTGASAGKTLYPTVQFTVPGSIGSSASGASAGKVLPTIEFHFFNLLSQGDSFDILAVLTTPEWTVSNPRADGTMTLDSGSRVVSRGQVTYAPPPSSQPCWNRLYCGGVTNSVPFMGQLTVPEPESMTIFGVGVLALVGAVRRQRPRA